MATGDITGNVQNFYTASNALNKLSGQIAEIKAPPLPNVGANAGHSGKVGGRSGVTVAFPDADEFLRRFTVVHGNISDGMTKYSTAVGVVGKATSTIGDDYANTIDQTKVGADQVSQALGDIPQV
jgi:hypothetical protein